MCHFNFIIGGHIISKLLRGSTNWINGLTWFYGPYLKKRNPDPFTATVKPRRFMCRNPRLDPTPHEREPPPQISSRILHCAPASARAGEHRRRHRVFVSRPRRPSTIPVPRHLRPATWSSGWCQSGGKEAVKPTSSPGVPLERPQCASCIRVNAQVQDNS
jgi:hypothetical protein